MELIKSQEKNVGLAEEALRLAKARLDAGAGVQLDVLNAQVQLLTAQSTQLQALFGYNSSLAEFDRPRARRVLIPSRSTIWRHVRRDRRPMIPSSGMDAVGEHKTVRPLAYYQIAGPLPHPNNL